MLALEALARLLAWTRLPSEMVSCTLGMSTPSSNSCSRTVFSRSMVQPGTAGNYHPRGTCRGTPTPRAQIAHQRGENADRASPALLVSYPIRRNPRKNVIYPTCPVYPALQLRAPCSRRACPPVGFQVDLRRDSSAGKPAGYTEIITRRATVI